MPLADQLVSLAHAHPGPRFREAALDLLADTFEAEVGMFAVARYERAERGLEPSRAALERSWDTYGAELAPVYDAAARAGVATDVGVLGPRSLQRTRLYREVMGPCGGRESAFVVPTFRGHKLGVLMLGRLGGAFSRAAVAELGALAPTLALACAALAGPPRPEPLAPDLTLTERELLRHLSLGHTTREIAGARGTSYFTVRNQLSALFCKLGVANRTEAVGLLAPRD